MSFDLHEMSHSPACPSINDVWCNQQRTKIIEEWERREKNGREAEIRVRKLVQYPSLIISMHRYSV